MAGQGRLHRYAGGFRVADFANHDHIGILAQDGAQACGKAEANVTAHMYLYNTGQVKFDRVLDRDNLAQAIIEATQETVNRGGLA